MQEDLFLTPTEIELLATPEAAEPEAVLEAPAPESAPEPAAPEAPVPAPERSPAPISPDLTQQATEVLAQIEAKRDDLAGRYESGELSFKDYRAQERVLERHQREAETVITQAQITQQYHQQRTQQDWTQAVSAFRQDPANAVFESPVTLPLMESALSAIRAQHPGLSGLEQLTQAKGMVQSQMRALMGLDPAPAAAATPLRSKPQLPPSLGGVPVAEANDSNIEFSHLDKLSGLQLEKAVAKMNVDQRERWLYAA